MTGQGENKSLSEGLERFNICQRVREEGNRQVDWNGMKETELVMEQKDRALDNIPQKPS